MIGDNKEPKKEEEKDDDDPFKFPKPTPEEDRDIIQQSLNTETTRSKFLKKLLKEIGQDHREKGNN